MKTIFDDEYKKIVSGLKEARSSKGLSQKQLADTLGYSQSYVSKIEQGQIRLDIVQLKKLYKALDKDIRDLL